MPNGRSGGFLIARDRLKALLRSVAADRVIGDAFESQRQVTAGDAIEALSEHPAAEIKVEEQDQSWYVIHFDHKGIVIRPSSDLFGSLREHHVVWLQTLPPSPSTDHALERLRQPPPIETGRSPDRESAEAAKQPLDDEELSALIKSLDAKTTLERRQAVARLGAFGDQRAVGPLLEAFDNSLDVDLRPIIVETLEALGHPTDRLRRNIDIYDPVPLLHHYLNELAAARHDRSALSRTRMYEMLAANVEREGAPASDAVADIARPLFAERSSRAIGLVMAALGDASLTPKLEALLTDMAATSASEWTIPSIPEIAATLLVRLDVGPRGVLRMKEIIQEGLRTIAARRQRVQDADGRVYLPSLVPAGYKDARFVAKSRSADLLRMLEHAETCLDAARDRAREGAPESRSQALAALDEAESELTRALEYADVHLLPG